MGIFFEFQLCATAAFNYFNILMEKPLLSKVNKQKNLHAKISVAVDAEKRELTNIQSFRGISFEEAFKMSDRLCKKVSIYCVYGLAQEKRIEQVSMQIVIKSLLLVGDANMLLAWLFIYEHETR